MPITRSAKKSLRVAKRRRLFNLRRKKAMGRAIKAFRQGPTAANLAVAYQAIDKAAKKGVIKKNNAARKKSQLAKLLRQNGN